VHNCLVVVQYTARNIMAKEDWKFKDKQDEERIDFDASDNDHGTFLVCKCCKDFGHVHLLTGKKNKLSESHWKFRTRSARSFYLSNWKTRVFRFSCQGLRCF